MVLLVVQHTQQITVFHLMLVVVLVEVLSQYSTEQTLHLLHLLQQAVLVVQQQTLLTLETHIQVMLAVMVLLAS
jgi:hypothetical protein